LLSLAKSLERVGDIEYNIDYSANKQTEKMAYGLNIKSLNDNIIPILTPSYPNIEITDGILIFDINAEKHSIDELLSFYCQSIGLKKENNIISIEKTKQ
jgi:hypothetical protein